MSYDLYFTARPGSAPVTPDDLLAYFEGRRHYTQVEDPLFYVNEDTGVYFGFAARNHDDDEDAEADAGGPVVASFNINYFRPHVFGLEALPEVQAFVDCFGFDVVDGQLEGMGTGPFNPDGFLSGWNAGNRFGYRAICQHEGGPGPLHSAPTAEIRRAWRWNLRRERRQQPYGERLFVPRIMYAATGGKTLSVVVWGDGIPTLLPRVDAVLLAREELAPRSFWGRAKPDTCLARWADLTRVLADGSPRTEDGSDCWEFDYSVRLASVTKLFKDATPFAKEELQIISTDQVLDREELEAAQREARQ